jgi:hypothetical protein
MRFHQVESLEKGFLIGTDAFNIGAVEVEPGEGQSLGHFDRWFKTTTVSNDMHELVEDARSYDQLDALLS